MALRDWTKPRTAEAWSLAVGKYGDIFQKSLTIPYFLSVLDYVSSLGGSTTLQHPPAEQKSITQRFYENLKISWTTLKPMSEARPFERLLSTRLRAFTSFVGKVMLDLGCGEGFLSRMFVEAGGDAIGFDGSPELIKKACEKFREMAKPRGKATFECKELEELVRNNLRDADLVVISNVLDHLTSVELKDILRNLAIRLGSQKRLPLCVVVTLNPDFFFGPEQWGIEECPASPRQAILGPASLAVPAKSKSAVPLEKVDVWPRPWQRFERLFATAGFHVLSCEFCPMCLLPDSLCDLFLSGAGLDPKNGDIVLTATPFVLWTLLPNPAGDVVTFDKAQAILANSKYACVLKPGGTAAQELEKTPARIVNYKAQERLAYAQNLGGNCFLITREYAEMRSRVDTKIDTKQIFDEYSPFIGELETGDDIYGSRYIYDVYAGKKGCEALLIPRPTFDGMMRENKEVLGTQLFQELRDRVTAFSWVYHLSGEHGKKVGPDKRHTTRNFEYFARVILFTASLECRSQRRSNGSVILLDEPALRDIFGGVTGFRDVLTQFVEAGVVDAFPIPKRPPPITDKLFSDYWGTAVEECLRGLVVSPLAAQKTGYHSGPPAAGREADLMKETDSIWLAFYPLTSIEAFQPKSRLFCKGDVKTKESRAANGSRLILTAKASEAADEIARKIRAYSNDGSASELMARRVIANLAFVQRSLFKAETEMFFVVNDARLLRQVAYDVEKFRPRIDERLAVREAILSEGYETQSRQNSRYSAYLFRAVKYLRSIWARNLNVGFSVDEYLKRRGDVEKTVENGFPRGVQILRSRSAD